MLILGRELGESIMVGNVKITVLRIKKSQVRLGIDAPKDVPVHREEVYDEIQKETKNAVDH